MNRRILRPLRRLTMLGTIPGASGSPARATHSARLGSHDSSRFADPILAALLVGGVNTSPAGAAPPPARKRASARTAHGAGPLCVHPLVDVRAQYALPRRAHGPLAEFSTQALHLGRTWERSSAGLCFLDVPGQSRSRTGSTRSFSCSALESATTGHLSAFRSSRRRRRSWRGATPVFAT
jgi:hypothetical protein